MATGIFGNRGKKCKCGGSPFSRLNREGEMYCVKCYRRIKKYGYFKRVSKDLNKIILKDNYCIIDLYNINSNKINEAIVDKNDYIKIKKLKWGVDGRGYVYTKSIKNETIKLHQLILGKKKGYEIDHINGDKLNNRKGNLRHLTHQQNLWNNKKAKGYYFDKRRNKYIVRICKDYKQMYFGGFENEEDAIKKVKELRILYFGEFACNDYLIK